MTSTIVPPVDLAPGMPSRVVTISATDVTEGGTSLEGQMVRFALSDTLDVSSGGDVIAKTQAEVVLDSNGEGRIRLPVYDEDVKTWCGKDWAILVTATWGSQKAIRVPAGTSSIALSALPHVRPLRGRELQWAISGAGVSVVEGAQWGASVDLDGGVLRFVITVPPGGTAWDKTVTPLDSSDDLSTAVAGIYRVGNGAVATALGLPIKDVSALTIVRMSGSPSTHSALVEQWGYDGEGGVEKWQAWRGPAGEIGKWEQVGSVEARVLAAGEGAERLGTGVYGAVWDRYNPGTPPGLSGSLVEAPVGDATWSQMWQTWTLSGAADLLVRSQSASATQVWQRPESPRAVEWARSEIAAFQASVAAPRSDGAVPSSAWSARAGEIPLVVPTPDGSGQATHPSVLDIPAGWNGHRYWMAYTPYTYADDATEDPCVAWSDNGAAWTAVPAAFPLDDAPGGTDYTSDTHAVLHNGTMYVTWRRTVAGESTKFYLRTSTDGTTWTPRQLLWDTGGLSAFSQALVKTASGWRLWFIGGAAWDRKLGFVDTASADPTTGWGAVTWTYLSTPEGREPWHVDVHLHGGRWWGVLTDTELGKNGVNCRFRLMQSADGLTWDVAQTQLVPHLGYSHDVLYKASLVLTGSWSRPDMALWYSGLAADRGWWLYKSGPLELHEPRGEDTDWSAAITALNTAAT